MSAINVNSITGRTGTHGPVLTGITTISGELHVGSGVSFSGIGTFSNGLHVTSGNIGIGTTNPQRLLHLYTSDNTPLLLQSPDTLVDIVSTDVDGSTRIRTSGGELRFFTGGDGNSVNANNANANVAITTTGNMEIANGNLVFSTAGTGIDFSATGDGSGTMSSELLDDYEEGTWTPVISDNPTSGNTATGSFNGVYTKVGRMVTLCMDCANINTSGMNSGSAIYIQGIPYSIASNYTGTIRFGGVSVSSQISLSGNYTNISIIAQDNNITYLRVLQTSTSSSDAASVVTVSQLNSGAADIRGSVTYFTTS